MLRRLLPDLRLLLADYGFGDARLRTLAALDGMVARVRPRTPVAGIPPGGAVLRVCSKLDDDNQLIDDGIAWLQSMAEAGLHVPRPIADRAGRRRREVMVDGEPRASMLLTWVDGRFLDATLTATRMRQLGRLIGAMHAHADRLDAAGRLPSREPTVLGDLPAWAAGEAPPGKIPARLQTLAGLAASRLQGELAAWPRSPPAWGFVHGDLHFGNYLFRGGEAGVIDFGACGRGPRALDLAGALQNIARPMYGNHDHRARYAAMRAALFEGYAEHAPLSADIARQFEACAVVRVFVTLTWMAWDWPHTLHYPWGPNLLQGAEQVFRDYLDGQAEPGGMPVIGTPGRG